MKKEFQKYQYIFADLSARFKNILKESVDVTDRNSIIKKVLGLIDLTTLSGDDTDNKVVDLCLKAKSFLSPDYNIPNVAAVCVYPVFAEVVSYALQGTGIKTACVAGGFPG